MREPTRFERMLARYLQSGVAEERLIAAHLHTVMEASPSNPEAWVSSLKRLYGAAEGIKGALRMDQQERRFGIDERACASIHQGTFCCTVRGPHTKHKWGSLEWD